MKLYLVQHGNQVSEDVNPNQPLSEQGRSDCEKVAAFAAKAGVKVGVIFHSVKLRAKQTAEIFAKHIMMEGEQPEEKEGLKPMDDVNVWPDNIKQVGEDLMLVGHLPFMQKLSSLLLTGDFEKSIVAFNQGGIVCLEQDEDGKWNIEFIIQPKLLQQ